MLVTLTLTVSASQNNRLNYHCSSYAAINCLWLETFFNFCFRLNLKSSNILMCLLLYLLICTVLRAHIIVVDALHKIYNYYYYPTKPWVQFAQTSIQILQRLQQKAPPVDAHTIVAALDKVGVHEKDRVEVWRIFTRCQQRWVVMETQAFAEPVDASLTLSHDSRISWITPAHDMLLILSNPVDLYRNLMGLNGQCMTCTVNITLFTATTKW